MFEIFIVQISSIILSATCVLIINNDVIYYKIIKRSKLKTSLTSIGRGNGQMEPNILDILRDSIGRKRKLKAPDVAVSSKTTSDKDPPGRRRRSKSLRIGEASKVDRFS